jgi:hypothetical protein
MAGSYKHCVTDAGKLRRGSFADLVENLGDAYEAVEEMYGMIWMLARGDAVAVEAARIRYGEGLAISPGREEER